VIHTTDLTRTFTRKKEVVEAVKAINLTVQPGELVAFLGPNGAGKSTTLRMLTSLLRPTSGTAVVAGFDVARDPAQVRAHIGYIGQGNGAGHSYRVVDELHNQGRFYGLTSDDYRSRATDLMTALELRGLETRKVSTLSGGQRRRLDVALGLMNRPGLLFLDEPSTGMDPHSRANLWEHILRLRERYGMTLVLTTHYLDEADSMAERVVIIDAGSVIADSTAPQLKREHADDVITLTLAAPPGRSSPDETRDELRQVLREQGRLGDISLQQAADGQRVRITLNDGPRRLPGVLFTLRAHGLDVRAAELKQASLDDVFLNLTGRSLREEGAAA
jgi:ABC-2 type transport system ATP-binding protein